MKALFHKELRNLMSLFPVFFLLFCGDIIVVPLTQPLDEVSWFEIHSGLSADSIGPFLFYLMGIIVAYSLFPREYEERTIEFLHSLPVSRGQIFVAKWMAGTVLILAVCLCHEITNAVMQMGNGDSLTSAQFRWATLLKLLFLASTTALVGRAHGLLLSFGRQFGFLFLGFAAWGVGWLQSQYPYLHFLDPLSMAKPNFRGMSLIIPWSALSWHVITSLLALLVSYRLWSSRGHQGTYLLVQRAKLHRKKLECLTGVALIVLVVLFLGLDDSEPAEEAPSYATARTETDHYNLTFPVSLRGRALKLASQADSIYRYVDEQMGEVRKERIIADLTDVSREHLGIASLNKIRVDIASNQEPELLEHILCHETVHVFCFRLSGPRGRQHLEHLGFFSEGTAEYFAFERAPSSRSRRDARRHALAMYKHHRLDFSTLVSAQTAEKYDENVNYTLGELWVDALVECYGKDAPTRVWKAIGREDGPRLEAALVFWQDSLQAAGYSFERVRSRWLEQLKQLEKQESEFLEQLPRIRGTAVVYDGEIYLEATSDRPLPAGWEIVARVRTPHGKEARTVKGDSDSEPGQFSAYVPSGYGDVFDYQFGVDFSESAYPYFEEWKSHKG